MKTEVLSLILSRPNVRTVEIADRLDMDPECVRPLIADEIKRGIIVEEPVVAPNGRTVQSFRYATAAPAAAVVLEAQASPFPARVLRSLPPTERPIVERERPLSSRPVPMPPPRATDPLSLALSPAHVATEPAPELAQAAADEPLEIDVPVTRKEGVPLVASAPAVFTAGRAKAPTRVELALACLRAAHPSPVQTVALASAMGLPSGHHPTSYLKMALNKARVLRNGTEWALGPSEAGNVPFAGWANPPAAVELPAPVVKPRDVPLSPDERAIADELPADDVIVPEPDPAGACVAGFADDCDCDDCKTVAALQSELALAAPVEQPAAQVEQAHAPEVPKFLDIPSGPKWTPEAARAKVAARKLDELRAVNWGPTGEQRPVGISAEVVGVLAHDGLSLVKVPTGGLPNIKTPYIPQVASGAPDITRNGLYENGEFRKPAEEVLAFHPKGVEPVPPEMGLLWTRGGIAVAANDVRAGMLLNVPAEKFLAAILSDGSLELRLPGRGVVPLTTEEARELYQFMQRMGYAAWPKAA